MSSHPPLSRVALARAEKARRRGERGVLGRLRDRVIRKATVKRYRAHIEEFFRWMRRQGLRIPARTPDFDLICCSYAESLWEEGEAKSVLANTLCGLQHEVPSLFRQLHGSWRLYGVWTRSEPQRRAPALDLTVTQGIAGFFAAQGQTRAAVCVLLSHHCCLRSAEMFEMRTGDFNFASSICMLLLRDTKIGGRIGITEDVTVLDAFLLPRLRVAVRETYPGDVIIGMTPAAFRAMWKQAVRALQLPGTVQPYGLRRGGATAWFQATNSFAKVAERGRWRALQAMRLYITTAIQEWASMTLPQEVRNVCNKYGALLWKLPIR